MIFFYITNAVSLRNIGSAVMVLNALGFYTECIHKLAHKILHFNTLPGYSFLLTFHSYSIHYFTLHPGKFKCIYNFNISVEIIEENNNSVTLHFQF